MKGNQYFLLPPQPAPDDKRPRNAFGFLKGFGEAYAAYYAEQDRLKATNNQEAHHDNDQENKS